MLIFMLFNQVFHFFCFYLNKRILFFFKYLESNYTKFSQCWKALTRCAILCNTAIFKDDLDNLTKPINQRQCDGDASETAILKCMEAAVSFI